MKRRNVIVITLVACVLPAGCGHPTRPPVVAHFGALHEIMHGGSMEAVVNVNDYAGRPGVYAVGARAGLAGEVTILDGRAWLTEPLANGEFRTLDSLLQQPEGAALFVVSEVDHWREFTLAKSISLDALADEIRRLADQYAWPADGPFPVLIQATFPEFDGHIVDGSKIKPGDTPEQHHQAGIQLHEQDLPATMVGFYSESHAGVFTHRGKRLHLHVIVETRNYTAHVDNAVIPAGARISLPD